MHEFSFNLKKCFLIKANYHFIAIKLHSTYKIQLFSYFNFFFIHRTIDFIFFLLKKNAVTINSFQHFTS